MELKALSLPDRSSFRFYADFDIQVHPEAVAELTKEQLGLLRAIAASPAVTRRVAQMAVETDLADLTGRHIGGLFKGPDNAEILDCVLAGLSGSERAYWDGLRDAPGDGLHNAIVPVFLVFEVSLHRAGLEERSAVGSPLGKGIGPLLEADELNVQK